MREELTSTIALKLLGFTGMILQIDTLINTADTFKYLDSFGVLAVLIVGIRYFISELKRQQAEFSEKWKEQEERHTTEKDKEKEYHSKNEEILQIKIDSLQSEVLELRVKLSKYE